MLARGLARLQETRRRLRRGGQMLAALQHLDREVGRLVALERESAEQRRRIAELASESAEQRRRIAELEPQFAARERDAQVSFANLVHVATRGIAMAGDHRQILPVQSTADSATAPRKLRIGLFDNLANQAFITARALRRLGHDVDVVIQEKGFDSYPLARPQWEECDVEASDAASVSFERVAWEPPAFVRYVTYDQEMQARYMNRLSAADEVAALYRESFGKTLPQDWALVLAQHMAHWGYIRAMNDYDVVMLSMSCIMLGAFSPKPTVVLPLGGDLYIRAFDGDPTGLLFRAGFRQAGHLALPETDYFAYVERLQTRAPRSFLPLIVDTDVYRPGSEEALRADWKARIGGEHFVLGVCRQDWQWKGSDQLIRAFAAFRRDGGQDWRLLLQSWGSDLARSRALVSELGLDDVTLWLAMCSKPLLRRRQRAADVVADQFVMEGYGASVLESLAAAKPVIIAPVPEAAKHHFRVGPPPFVGARSPAEIQAALQQLADPSERARIGAASRRWVEAEHGHATLAPLYMDVFEATVKRATSPDAGQAGHAGDHRGGTASERAGAPERAPAVRPESSRSPAHALADIVRERRGEVRERWNRVLPMGEYFGDRWEKARFLGFGEGASIYDSAVVIGDVAVGAKTWIGPGCVLDGSGRLAIGANCSISAGVQVYTHDTVAWAVSGGVAPYRRAETTIEDEVYLGPNVVVAAGSRIGRGAIVGAQSFVKGTIPPYAFAVGSPARVIGRVQVAADGAVTIVRLAGPDAA